MRDEEELLVDCLERLNRSAIPYMLTGSMASNYWGIPRSTHDLDFVLVLGPDAVGTLLAAFNQGFFLQAEQVQKAFLPPYQFNAIDEQSALKVDFWLLQQDAFEQAAFARRRNVTLLKTPAWIATPEDVILHKLYWNRLTPSDRQLQDAASVYQVQAGLLDSAYLIHWAGALRVQRELDALTSGRIKPKST